MFSNYMENMSPFVKPERPFLGEEACLGWAHFFSCPIVLLLSAVCRVLPSHKHAFSSDMQLLESKAKKHLHECLHPARGFSQAPPFSLTLGLHGNCPPGRTTGAGLTPLVS